MSNYGIENFPRFQRLGVTEEDIKILKAEKVREAFIEVKDDMSQLTWQLAPGIKDGRWSAILGDDVSGRLVANIVGEVASRYAQEHEQPAPKRYFFAGGTIPYDDPQIMSWSRDAESEKVRERQALLQQYIDKISNNLGKHVLIVTEQIRNGSTINRIGAALKAKGIDFDVASMWIRDTIEEQKRQFNSRNPDTFKDAMMYGGRENAGASDPFSSEVSAVFYNLGRVLSDATGVKKTAINPASKINNEADRDLVILAREESSKLADELYQEVFRTKTV